MSIKQDYHFDRQALIDPALIAAAAKHTSLKSEPSNAEDGLAALEWTQPYQDILKDFNSKHYANVSIVSRY
jgi:hypothetical protein